MDWLPFMKQPENVEKDSSQDQVKDFILSLKYHTIKYLLVYKKNNIYKAFVTAVNSQVSQSLLKSH